MRRANEPVQKAFGSPGKQRPAGIALALSKASARDLHKGRQRNFKPVGGSRPVRGARRFFGASPSHRPWISASDATPRRVDCNFTRSSNNPPQKGTLLL